MLQATAICCKWSIVRRAQVLSDIARCTVLGSLLFSLYLNDILIDIDSEKTFCWWLHLLPWDQGHWGHFETSEGCQLHGMLCKEAGYELPTNQIQYQAAKKEKYQKDPCSLHLGWALYLKKCIKYTDCKNKGGGVGWKPTSQACDERIRLH